MSAPSAAGSQTGTAEPALHVLEGSLHLDGSGRRIHTVVKEGDDAGFCGQATVRHARLDPELAIHFGIDRPKFPLREGKGDVERRNLIDSDQ